MSYTPSNLRQNPFTGAFSWRAIADEEQTVAEFNFLPGIYGFILRDRPNPAASLTVITDDSAGDEFEKITSGTPNPGQVRIDYTRGICVFNIADNGKSFLVSYQGGGSNLTYEALSGIATYGPQVDQLEIDVAALEGRVDTAEGNITTLQGDVSALQGDVGDLQDDVSNLNDAMNLYKFKMLGEPFALFNHIAGVSEPPSSNFIKLTKGLTGSGQYNEGKLTSQNTVTSGNVRYYTAVINDAGSPLNGQTIPLINSTEISNSAGVWVNLPAVVGALESAGSFFANQLQGHRHPILSAGRLNGSGPGFPGATSTASFAYTGTTASGTVDNATGDPNASDQTNGTPRFGTQTRQDTFAAVFYMRYK